MAPTADGVTSWLAAPRSDRGIRFARRDGTWDWLSYVELAELTGRFARHLRSRRVGAGDVVALVLGTGPEFVIPRSSVTMWSR